MFDEILTTVEVLVETPLGDTESIGQLVDKQTSHVSSQYNFFVPLFGFLETVRIMGSKNDSKPVYSAALPGVLTG